MAERPVHIGDSVRQGQVLTYIAPSRAVLEEIDLPALKEGQVRIKALYSGISRGTEGLVFKGLIPKSEWTSMRCPNQRGAFPFPVSYGYQMVGEVVENNKSVINLSVGDTVFLLNPHQTEMILDADSVNLVPVSIPSRRAVLAANAETALNALWDSGLGEQEASCVIGAGVVGLLTATFARKTTGRPTTIIDTDVRKREIAEKLGLAFKLPTQVSEAFDVLFHTSASEKGLQFAIDHATFEGRIIEMSWYGEKKVSLELGGPFHSKRLQIKSSQVGQVSPSKRETMSYKDRMAAALQLLDDDRLDALLEEDIPFHNLPNHLDVIFDPDNPVLCQVIRYD